MHAEPLKPRERSVLHGLASFPSFNDRRLAEVLGARPSTVTAVRTRLGERGLFRRAYLPYLPAMGAGVLSISSGAIHSGCLADLKRALRRGHFPAAGCDSFLALAGPFGWLEMGAFPNYSEAQRRGEGLHRVLAGTPGAAAGPCDRSIFPAEVVRYHNFFDFAPLLGRLFGIREAAARPRSSAPPARKQGPLERLSLYGLVKWPGAADGEIAGNLGVSRQAVARARRVLVAEGRLLPAVFPDLGRLGVSLLALYRFRFAAGRGPAALEAAAAKLLQGIPHVLAVSAGAECVVLGAYRDLAAFERESEGPLRQAAAQNPLEGAPKIRTFLLEDTVFARDLDFVPFVKAALGLDIAD